MVALFQDPIEFDCESLKKAMKGLGTDEDTLIEIIVSRSPTVLRSIIARYKEMYNRGLLSETQLKAMIQKGTITEVEYNIIVAPPNED